MSLSSLLMLWGRDGIPETSSFDAGNGWVVCDFQHQLGEMEEGDRASVSCLEAWIHQGGHQHSFQSYWSLKHLEMEWLSAVTAIWRERRLCWAVCLYSGRAALCCGFIASRAGNWHIRSTAFCAWHLTWGFWAILCAWIPSCKKPLPLLSH